MHLFATWKPSFSFQSKPRILFTRLCKFWAKQTAIDFESGNRSDVANFIYYEFYVDDGLYSTQSEDEALGIIHRTKVLCRRVGTRMYKLASNSKKVIQSLSNEDHPTDVKTLHLLHDIPHIETDLHVFRCVESDTLQFPISLSDKPLNKRGSYLPSVLCTTRWIS